MADLNGSAQRVALGPQVFITAPGLRGTADLRLGSAEQLRAVEESTAEFDAALARADMEGAGTIEIKAQPAPGEGRAANLRDVNGDDAILLEVPDYGPEMGQVVASVDEAGAVSWHFPLENGEIQGPADRGPGGSKRFLIRKHQPSPAPGAAEQNRGIFGAIGRKLLKVIVYPITDAIIGKPAAKIAEHWESKNRAYQVRDFLPTNYNKAGRDLTAQDLTSLSGGKALLFVHGTFSTTPGAFGDLPAAFVTKMHERYQGRVFAFNHYTMSHDPAKNAMWLTKKLAELSPAARINADIVCHSRGGLVARTLAEGAFGVPKVPLGIDKIVFVAVPNHGTLLAQPDHMVTMIDRLTTGLNLLPPSGFADILDGILIGVKIIGHGALKGLEGLQSMNVQEQWLTTLNAGGKKGAPYYGVAADYEPQDPGLKALVSGTVDATMDRIFQSAGNDLVVPEAGVYEANGSPAFPIPSERLLRIPASAGRAHSSLFDFTDVVNSLDRWLT